jgi:hypothetical protein
MFASPEAMLPGAGRDPAIKEELGPGLRRETARVSRRRPGSSSCGRPARPRPSPGNGSCFPAEAGIQFLRPSRRAPALAGERRVFAGGGRDPVPVAVPLGPGLRRGTARVSRRRPGSSSCGRPAGPRPSPGNVRIPCPANCRTGPPVWPRAAGPVARIVVPSRGGRHPDDQAGTRQVKLFPLYSPLSRPAPLIIYRCRCRLNFDFPAGERPISADRGRTGTGRGDPGAGPYSRLGPFLLCRSPARVTR